MSGKPWARFRPRNNKLTQARLEAGLSQAKLGELAGLTITQINTLECARVPARYQHCKEHPSISAVTGGPTSAAKQVAMALGMLIEDLFPLPSLPEPFVTIGRTVGTWCAVAVEGPEVWLEQQRKRRWLIVAFRQLRPRERFALMASATGWTLDDVAVAFGGVSRERARQVRERAEVKLRRWYAEACWFTDVR